MYIHVAAVTGRDLFNPGKLTNTVGETLCGLRNNVNIASDGGYVYASVQGFLYCCGTHVHTKGGSTVSLASMKSSPGVCQRCVAEIEKRKLV